MVQARPARAGLSHDLLRRRDDLLGRQREEGLLDLVAGDRRVLRATRAGGALSDSKPCSLTVAAISNATPQRSRPSSVITRCPVLATESRIVCSSSGTSVRRSITSASMPSPASCSAASSEATTIIEQATIGDVGALALHGGLAERDLVVVVGHLVLGAVAERVRDHQRRVVALERGAQQPLEVGGTPRHRDLDAGHVPEHPHRALRVLGGAAVQQAVAHVEGRRGRHLAAEPCRAVATSLAIVENAR